MNYEKIYNQLIQKRKFELIDKGDLHHIIPRSWNGTDEIENLVKLLPREHFLAHLLLVKIASSENFKRKMLYAIHRMTPKGKRTSRNYLYLRSLWIELHLKYMSEVIGVNGETRRELTTRKSADTMANTFINGVSLLELRVRKISKHNSDIHIWENLAGKQFIGTALELSRAHRGEAIEPSKLTRNLGTPEYHRGWRSVEGGKQPSDIMKRYQIVRTWINRMGESFTGTSYEFSEYVKPKQIIHPNRIERFAIKNARLDGWKVKSI